VVPRGRFGAFGGGLVAVPFGVEGVLVRSSRIRRVRALYYLVVLNKHNRLRLARRALRAEAGGAAELVIGINYMGRRDGVNYSSKFHKLGLIRGLRVQILRARILASRAGRCLSERPSEEGRERHGVLGERGSGARGFRLLGLHHLPESLDLPNRKCSLTSFRSRSFSSLSSSFSALMVSNSALRFTRNRWALTLFYCNLAELS